MIHHWVGTIALPGATLAEALELVQDYDRYAEIYDFHVQRFERLSADDGRFAVYLRVFMKKIVTVVLDTEYDVVFEAIGDRRAFVASYATRIVEVDTADTPEERTLPAGRDHGLLWRLNMYCSFDERGDQALMQCEWIGLSRSIPWLLRWVVTPLVTSVPRDLLMRTLEAARDHLAMSGADG
ncbi:MAG: hypothetical protein QGF21_10935 [Vicinamibacterales bacterium]|jgi:hypothetical protein|nr:hypothetical protein [Acidobacteriota bacterium]MDP7470750.1 hypothetical protein [Vicinamibacterales bacterium]MDP7672444.1 hypothetical protein [Vicinamibacterales bacterium]HJO38519.1 hypothetical protein [Vicinamibacterales bacterium]|tara:strand:- start:1194 stop:1739 length:546 start_codon:yes stop_codon:yes gene_type:complete